MPKLHKKTRKMIAVLLLLAVVTASIGAYFLHFGVSRPVQAAQILSDERMQGLRLTAHRGFSALAPENTIPAIDAAAKAGFYAAEFDIHETADGAWIVNHDETVDAMTDGTGLIKEMTLAELKSLAVDSGANIAEHAALRLPTLEEALDACKAGGIRPQIEIKAGSTAALQTLLKAISARGMLADAIIISFNHEILAQLRAIEPAVEYWFLCHELSDENLALAQDLGKARVAFNGSKMKNTPARLRAFRAAGLDLAVWTIDQPLVLWWYAAHEVTYITTNRFTPAESAV